MVFQHFLDGLFHDQPLLSAEHPSGLGITSTDKTRGSINAMTATMPLTNEQRTAVEQLRAYLTSTPFQPDFAKSADQRARRPDPAHVPTDMAVHVEIAPPSPHALPLLDGTALKTLERVPVFFYTLQNDQSGSDVAERTSSSTSMAGETSLATPPTNRTSTCSSNCSAPPPRSLVTLASA